MAEQVVKHVETSQEMDAFHGSIFSGEFKISVSCRDVMDKEKLTRFVSAFIASMGGIQSPFEGISQEQLKNASRLSKILDRFDRSNYPGERANAFRILQANLQNMDMSLDAFRPLHEAMTPHSGDKEAKTEVHIQKASGYYSGWKRSRDWFDALSEKIAQPLGLWFGRSRFGKVCVDGKCFLGPLVPVLAGAMAIAKICDAALRACHYSRPYVDDFCAGFCSEMISDANLSQTWEEEQVAARRREQARSWTTEFGWTCQDEPLSSKFSEQGSAAANEGKSAAQKRKADSDLQTAMQTVERHKLRALGA
eukprot:symbB.v1.2.024651.t1/scaffold2351.1/size81609/2